MSYKTEWAPHTYKIKITIAVESTLLQNLHLLLVIKNKNVYP